MKFKLVHVSAEVTCVTLNYFPDPSVMEVRSEAVQMCPRYPEPVPLDHPLPILKEALEKVCGDLMDTQLLAAFLQGYGGDGGFATEHPWV